VAQRGGGERLVEGDDELRAGGNRCGEDVAVVRVVGHRRLQPFDFGGVDFSFLEGAVHRRGRMRALQSGVYSSSSASRSRVSRSEKG